MTNDWPERKSFEQLGKEKATCLEYAMNGYVRIYEQGQTRCKCRSCVNMEMMEKNDRSNDKHGSPALSP